MTFLRGFCAILHTEVKSGQLQRLISAQRRLRGDRPPYIIKSPQSWNIERLGK